MVELAWTDEMTGLPPRPPPGGRWTSCSQRTRGGLRLFYFRYRQFQVQPANDPDGHAFGDSVICASPTIPGPLPPWDVLGRIGGGRVCRLCPGYGRGRRGGEGP